MSKAPEYRLADSTVVEPLINRWLAWSYLVAPVPASLHLVDYQIKALKSYLQDPLSHVKASRDPNLMGGPFVNIEVERAGEVKQLLAETEKQQADHIKLARAITDFHTRLSSEAKGQNLEPYYKKIPEPLRGYVELVYDYTNHPTVRLQENLLYRSEYYKPELQALRLFKLDRDDSRPFFMSTPRLPQPDRIDWQVGFDDARVDELFRLDLRPRQLGEIGELLGLSGDQSERLRPLLSEAARPVAEGWQGEGVRVKYFGHACVLVEWNGQTVLTDPFIAAVPAAGGVERYGYNDLPAKIDYVIITHNHCDHFLLETLLRLRGRIGCLVVPRSYGYLYGDVSLKKMAVRLGFKRVEELDTLERIEMEEGEIVAVPFMGEHGDLGHGKTGYVVRAGREQMLFAADSDCLDKRAYEHIRKFLGPVQTLFLGTECVGAPLSWSYGPLFLRKPAHALDQSRRQRGSDSVAGLNILDALGSKRFYNYGMGQEPWIEHILALALPENSPQIREANKVIEKSREKGFLAAERLFGKAEFYLTGEAAGAPSSVSLSAGGRRPASPAAEVPEAERRLDSPLSLIQQRIWSLSQSQTPPNLVALIRLDGPLEPAALRESLNQIVSRHQVLRTAIRQVKGELVQMVAPSQPLNLPVTDLSAGTDADRAAKVEELIAERLRKGFDLKQALMLNAELLRLNDERHYLLLTLARIAADDDSVKIITNELADLYGRITGKDGSRPADPANQYEHFAARERQALETGAWQADIQYWQQRLSGASPVLNIAPSRARAQTPSSHRAVSPIALEAELSGAVASAAGRLGYSLPVILTAAFKALLYRYSGQTDLVVGTRQRRRDADQLEGLVGPVAKLSALRTDLSDDPSFLKLLARVESESAAAGEHQAGGYEVVIATEGEAGGWKWPGFRAMFVMDAPGPGAFESAGLVFTLEQIRGAGEPCDLCLCLREDGGHIVGFFEYDADRFGVETITTMQTHFKTLLGGFVAHPETKLLDLNLAGEQGEVEFNTFSRAQSANDVEDQFVF